ncbi:MAG: hypothetical protein ACYC99_04395 [Candidatus Geothermincolia bacterium]
MAWEGPVALVAVGLGVINAAILSYQLWADNRIKVRVSVDLDYFGQPGYMKPGFFIEARNHGKRNVSLQSAEVIVGDKFKVRVPADPPEFEMPHCLVPVSSHAVWMDPYDLGEKMVAEGITGTIMIIGSFEDQLGNRYESEPFSFTVDDWLVDSQEV